MNKRILFTKINTAELVSIPEDVLGDGEVCVETVFSAVSCGTERANIIGDLNINAAEPEPKKVCFPRGLGYSSSGIVRKVGKDVSSVSAGDKVCMLDSFHKKYNTLPENNVIKIPGDVSLEEAAFSRIATFPMAALRKTRVEIGESMLVMGQGTLGQIAVMLSKAAGAAPVIAADPVPERRQSALLMGADYALDPMLPDFSETVKNITDGGVNCVIEVTGKGEGFNEALNCIAKFGRIALLGCTRDKNFTVDYYRKIHYPGITVVGAHTNARPVYESYPGYFTQRDDAKVFLELLNFDRISLKDFISEPVSPSDCQSVYTCLINDPDFPPYTLFDWRNI